ncbi:unnamed protein product [Thelazia callipaeda]|uniref:Rab proteins geranylgeranyltransferase component A n=1 Tax=Thelazia callipaeda TaxID=103827 RepID=A0A0N5CWY2_THECL|nr:unnamed protein product [Thelazia callipaeda]
MVTKNILPEYFDVVILGTGLPECIIAAACARSGLSVLHLDRNDYYGGLWASFNLQQIHHWLENESKEGGEIYDSSSFLQDGEKFVAASCRSFVEKIRYDFDNWKADELDLRLQNIDFQWRKFSLDLLPKILLSRGNMVKLLCDSSVARYCEFKSVDRFLCFSSQEDLSPLLVVPCSRGEIFRSDILSTLDKRRIMRFLQNCIKWRKNDNETNFWEEYTEKPFGTFIESFGITGRVKSIITDTLGILHSSANTREGLEAVCEFMESVGRYADSPFLWTLFGSGELPQGFARLCALFGGIYCLNRSVEGFIISNKRIEAVLTEGQRINCKHVITNRTYLPEQYLSSMSQKRINRTILISDQSILPDPEKEHISLLNLVSFENDASPYLLEVGYEGCAAPKGKYITHITARSQCDSYTILNPIVERLFEVAGNVFSFEKEISTVFTDQKPQIMWSLYFDVAEPLLMLEGIPINMGIVPCVDEHLNYDLVVCEVRLFKAKKIFKEFWPDYDFLPPSLSGDDDDELEKQIDIENFEENDYSSSSRIFEQT